MQPKKSIRVFIVDESPMCRFLYKRHLMNMGFSNIYLYENTEKCLKNIGLFPNIILMDFDDVNGNALEVLKEIKELNPSIRVLMLSRQQDIHTVIEAIRFGVSGYIMKDENQLQMLNHAFEKLLAENTFFFVN